MGFSRFSASQTETFKNFRLISSNPPRVSNVEKDLLEGFLLEDEQQPEYKLMPRVDELRENYQNTSMEGILRDIQGTQLMSAKEVIEDIEALITEREELQKEVFKDIEKILMSMNNFLSSQGGKIDAVELVKIKEKLIDIEEFKLNEKINAFRDIAMLKKELRDRMQDFKEKEGHADVLDKLLRG